MYIRILLFLSIVIPHLSIGQTPERNVDQLDQSLVDGVFSVKEAIVKVNDDIVFPESVSDSIALLSSINAFLASAQENRDNKWVLPSEKIETQILIDEIQEIHKNEDLEITHFYAPHLINIIPLENDKLALQIMYVSDHSDANQIRASFKLIAHQRKDSYLFSSPLKWNTQNWNSEKIENAAFYYPYSIQLEKVQRFQQLASLFDGKLDNSGRQEQYYLCSDEINPLHLFGVDYKSDYNGQKGDRSWEASEDDTSIFVLNAGRFYRYPEHDVWHNRLSKVISRRDVHRRVDCHIGTLYGGIWGIGWKELFPMFYEKFVVAEQVDWLNHKNEKSHFITKERRKNYTDDFIGALLIKKIEQERGFEGVWELLLTKRTKDENEYFEVIEKLTGITKQKYNQEVQKLVEHEILSLDS